MATPTSFLVLLESLQDTLEQGRYHLGRMALAEETAALRARLQAPVYTPAMEAEAARIAHLDELAQLLAACAPEEPIVRAVAAHSPILAFTSYSLASPADGALDGRRILVRAAVHRDLGAQCNIDLAGASGTRFALVARSEIVGVQQRPAPARPGAPSMWTA